MLGVSAAPPSDASGDRKSPSGAYWIVSDGAIDAGTPSVRRVCCFVIDRWNFDSAGHVASSRASNASDHVYCNGADASGDPVFSSVRRQRLYFVEGLINSPFAGHGWELSTL
jgi:hypothetical protein